MLLNFLFFSLCFGGFSVLSGHDVLVAAHDMFLELQATSVWLFQLDDSKSVHKEWLFHQTSIEKLLFRVPGCNVESEVERYHRPSVSLRSA